MTIHTKHEIGDKISVSGKTYSVVSIHLYESKNKHTERYYLGNEKWITICQETKDTRGMSEQDIIEKLKAENEALINGQLTLQRYIAKLEGREQS